MNLTATKPVTSSLVRGVAGVGGTAVMTAFQKFVEMPVTGRGESYAPASFATKVLGVRPSTRQGRRRLNYDSPRKLAASLGLDPRVRQSGERPARHGRISKRGNPHARHVLVEAAWQAMRTPGPLRAFGERIRARKGTQVAAVAVARKIATIAWQMLTREEDYAFQSPSLLRKKIRNAELKTGAPHLPTRHTATRQRVTPEERQRDRELQQQAENGYRRLIADWQATGPRMGAGATPGRASSRPSTRHATRQTTEPQTSAL